MRQFLSSQSLARVGEHSTKTTQDDDFSKKQQAGTAAASTTADYI